MKFITFDSSTKALSVALAEGELPTDFTLKSLNHNLGQASARPDTRTCG